mmetsp:Transcript_41741/g.129922  ORF Transcript_41741/g.129922 Transcript_41741/m.129922 type:complete len:298 (+) Transcript_41741:266-1159(+)
MSRPDRLEHAIADPFASGGQLLLLLHDVPEIEAQTVDRDLARQEDARLRVRGHTEALAPILAEGRDVDAHGLQGRDGRSSHGRQVGGELLDLLGARRARVAHARESLAGSDADLRVLIAEHRGHDARVVLAGAAELGQGLHRGRSDRGDGVIRELEDLMDVLLRGLAHLRDRLHRVQADGVGGVLQSVDEARDGLGVADLAERVGTHRAHGEGVVLHRAQECADLFLGLGTQGRQRLRRAQANLPILVIQRLGDLHNVVLAAFLVTDPAQCCHRSALRPAHLRRRPPTAVAHDEGRP